MGLNHITIPRVHKDKQGRRHVLEVGGTKSVASEASEKKMFGLLGGTPKSSNLGGQNLLLSVISDAATNES
jgi:hypothetical protein